MSKKSKFVTTHFRLKEKPDFDTQFSSKEKAMEALLESVDSPMTLEEAIDRLIQLSKLEHAQIYTSGYYYHSYEIEDLKEYIIKLKS